MNTALKTLAVTVATAAILALAAPHDAEARGFSRSGGYTTGKGHTGSWASQGTRTRGASSKSQTVTTDRDKTCTRSSETSYDRATGDGTRSVTGWNGNTRTATGNYDRDTGAYSGTVTGERGSVETTGTASHGDRTGTYTTGNGGTGSYAVDRSRDEDGGWTKSNTVTTDRGNTYTSSSSYDYDKETHTLDASHTGVKGNTHSGSVTFNGNE